jgi:hypothetical protein
MSTWSDYWQSYRKTTGKLTWRVAKPEDVEVIPKLRAASARVSRMPQKNPDIFALPILLALVAENQKGEVVDLLYVETQVELVKMGMSAEGFEESTELRDDLATWLRDLGFRSVTATCPTGFKAKMGKVFTRLGFGLLDDGLSRWKRYI